MWDWSDYELKQLFEIRDAITVLTKYSLENEDMAYSLTEELKEREKEGRK